MARQEPQTGSASPAMTGPAGGGGGVVGSTTTTSSNTKTRRSHRKSRNGCAECKRRHIRCDEGRPACTNCTIAERACSFPNASLGHHGAAAAAAAAQAGQTMRTGGASPAAAGSNINGGSLEVPSPLHHYPGPHSPARSSSSTGSGPRPMSVFGDDGLPPLHAAAGAAHHHQQHAPSHAPHHHPQQQQPQQPLPSQGLPRMAHQQSLPSFNESFADAAPPVVPRLHKASSSSTGPLPALQPQPPQQPQQQLPSPQSQAGSSSGIGPGGGNGSGGGSGSGNFDAQHMVLLHHVETRMHSDILGVGQTPTVIEMAIRHAVECPYLIDQLLALSAMHLAYQRPEHAATFRHQATELQTRGITHFAKETERLTTSEDNFAAPRFLYATLLSIHMLADTLAYHRADFDVFIDRFIECMHLHRGILYIVRPQFEQLMRSELEPILALTLTQLPRDPRRGAECDPLHAVLDRCALPPTQAAVCREASSMLQWAFDLSVRLPSPDVPHAISGWHVVLPSEFADVLRDRRPEALVILAYYGVLLHRARRYWICGGNGAVLVRAIARQLGPEWGPVMRWPIDVIDRERD